MGAARHMTRSDLGLVLAALAPLAAAGAHAQPTPQPPAFKSVLDCRGVGDPQARLACFDAAAAGLAAAAAQGEIVVVDRAQAAAAHREAFGLSLPSLDFVTRALKPAETEQVTGVVKALRRDASGRWTFMLADGPVWRQIDGDLAREPRAGSKVAIRRGALGSFLMNVDGQPAIKVHRDQ